MDKPQWICDLEAEYDMPLKDILEIAVEQAPETRQTKTEFAEECGVHPDTLRRYLRRYGLVWPRFWTEAQMRRPRTKFWGQPLTVDGVTKPLTQWAAEYGLPARRLRERVKAGWDPMKALTAPPMDSDGYAQIMREIQPIGVRAANAKRREARHGKAQRA